MTARYIADRISNGYFERIKLPEVFPFKNQHIRKEIDTYHTTLLLSPILITILQVSHNCNLNLSIVMLVSVSLMSDSLLSNLLVVHGILSLVDRVGTRYLFHGRCSSLLPNIERDFCDVLNFCLDELLVVRWCSQK